VDDVFEAATRASMLMREGVPTHGAGGGSGSGGEKHHRRKSSGKSGQEDGTNGKCCIIC